MKKLLTLFLTALFVLSAFALPVSAAGFPASGVTSVTLSSAAAYTTERTSNQEAALLEAEAFLASAGANVVIPGGAREIGAVTVATASGTKRYAFLSGASGYYLSDGVESRPVDYNDFERLVRAVDGAYDYVNPYVSSVKPLFYPYAPVPGAVADNQVLAIHANSYAFKRLNNRYAYRTTAFDMAVPTFSSVEGKLVTPFFSMTPEILSYSVVLPDVADPVWTGDQAAADKYRITEDGTYTVLVKAEYKGDFYQGAVTYAYTLKVGEAAPAEFTVTASHAAPGEMIILRVTGSDTAATASATTDLGYTPVFFRESATSQIALVPVSVNTAPGVHTVTITCGANSETLSYKVAEKQFVEQQLTVDESTAEATILSQEANNEYETVVAPLRFIGDSAKHWVGRFILPVSDEKVTSPFGIIRYVNGGASSTRHNALDLAVPLGTPVKASGGGRILYAGFLKLTGNTVIIEHGYGLKSWYYHMDSLNVKTGDMVARGDQIGAVGSTGFSTGAHMHFGMSVNNVFVNPYTLVDTDLAV